MRRFRWLLVAVFAVTACSGGADDTSGGEIPTITYDGSAATYTGPEQLPEGTQKFRLENDSAHSVDFFVATIDPGLVEGVTLEDAIEWGLTESDPPPWTKSFYHLVQGLEGGEEIETSGPLYADTMYELGVWDIATEQGHTAVWLDAVEQAG